MNMDDKVCGKFPDFCYKAFSKEEYAEAFISQGHFRMNCLGYCRNMEDQSRRDSTEGYGHTREPDKITVLGTIWREERGYKEHHIGMGNKIFCFSTCLPNVDHKHMSETFGKYIVRINQPKKLAEDINKYFISKGQRFLIEGCYVVYDKGQKQPRALTNNERVDLSYKQKPKDFSPDCEFRIVAIAFKFGDLCEEECKYFNPDGKSEPKCKFIEVNLEKRLNYLVLEHIN